MDISSIYNDLYSKEASNAKSKRLSDTVKNKDYSGATDEELMDVCKQFESYFVEQVLKNGMKAFTQGDITDSGSMATLTSYYKDNLMTKYAETITDKEDLGLAKILYEQMKRNLSVEIPKAEEKAATTEENAIQNDTKNDSETDNVSVNEAVSTILNEEE